METGLLCIQQVLFYLLPSESFETGVVALDDW